MSKVKTTKGRPNSIGGKDARDDIDWNIAESYYVEGEIIVEKNKHGDLIRKKPSYSDVARRFKCSPQLVGYHAKRRGWREKRKTWERMAQREVSEAVAKARALSLAEGAAILDAWLLRFRDMLEKDRVKVDSLSDFNIAIRLKAFIDSQGAGGKEGIEGVTLADLERAHREHRKRTGDIDADTAGVLVDESALH